MLDHHRDQHPGQRRPGQFRTRFSSPAHILAPHIATLTAAVAAHRDQQRRQLPPQQDAGQPPQHRIPHHPLTTAPATACRVGVGAFDLAKRYVTVVIGRDPAVTGLPPARNAPSKKA